MENEKPEPEIKIAEYATKKGEVVLRPHVYDGIQEYDQKLPNWWLFTFHGALLFFLGYWLVYYNTPWLRSDAETVESKMLIIQKKKAAALEATLATLDDATLVHQWSTDSTILASGEAIYQQVCIGCHGANLDAPQKLGLSLVDGEWKYGDRPMDLFALINEGTPADSTGMEPTGARMAPWGAVYSPKQVAEVVAFLISKNPADFEKF